MPGYLSCKGIIDSFCIHAMQQRLKNIDIFDIRINHEETRSGRCVSTMQFITNSFFKPLGQFTNYMCKWIDKGWILR